VIEEAITQRQPELASKLGCLPHAPPGSWSARQQQQVGQIRAAHYDLEQAYHLSQEFVMMLAEQRELDLDSWLTQAEHGGLPKFKKMAHGIRQDYATIKRHFRAGGAMDRSKPRSIA
jgi:transposase